MIKRIVFACALVAWIGWVDHIWGDGEVSDPKDFLVPGAGELGKL